MRRFSHLITTAALLALFAGGVKAQTIEQIRIEVGEMVFDARAAGRAETQGAHSFLPHRFGHSLDPPLPRIAAATARPVGCPARKAARLARPAAARSPAQMVR